MTELLDVAAVMERYRLRDRRAARKLMDDVGAFKVASSLYVRAADLEAHEQALIERRRAPAEKEPRAPARRRSAPRSTREPVRPGWWRPDRGDGSIDPPTNGGR